MLKVQGYGNENIDQDERMAKGSKKQGLIVRQIRHLFDLITKISQNASLFIINQYLFCPILLMEVDTVALKNRELSSKYLQLQQCGQCLNHIERFNLRDKYNQILEFESIDFRELFLLMVQTIYLLFMAQCHKVSIRISKEIFIRKADKNVYATYKTYILQEHFHALQTPIQQHVAKNYETYQWSNSNTRFQTNVFHVLEFFMRKITNYSQRYPQLFNKVNKLPFQEFAKVLMQLIKPNQLAIKDPRTLMQCLEKTDIFRDNSLLLTLNMSLFYEKLQPLIETDDIFSLLEEMEENFRQEYSKLLTIKLRYRLCSTFLEQVLKFLVNRGLIFFSVSVDEKIRQGKQNQTSQPLLGTKDQAIQQQESSSISLQSKWHFYTKSSFFPLNAQNFMQFISSNDLMAFQRAHRIEAVTKPNNYLMEVDCQREVIIVRTICSLGVNVENIDNILYQVNTVSQEWYYPTFQLVDSGIAIKGQETNANGKRLSLSISFKVTPKKSTLAQFFVILDVLLIHQKIFLVELNKPPYKREQQRYNLCGQNIKRMNILLLKNIERVYEAQLNSDPVDID